MWGICRSYCYPFCIYFPSATKYRDASSSILTRHKFYQTNSGRYCHTKLLCMYILIKVSLNPHTVRVLIIRMLHTLVLKLESLEDRIIKASTSLRLKEEVEYSEIGPNSSHKTAIDTYNVLFDSSINFYQSGQTYTDLNTLTNNVSGPKSLSPAVSMGEETDQPWVPGFNKRPEDMSLESHIKELKYLFQLILIGIKTVCNIWG